jgi:hypothetical protein
MVLSDRARQALGESPRPGCPVCRQRHRQLHVAVEGRRRAMTSYPMALYLHTTFQTWIAPRHVPDQDEDRPALRLRCHISQRLQACGDRIGKNLHSNPAYKEGTMISPRTMSRAVL